MNFNNEVVYNTLLKSCSWIEKLCLSHKW